MLSILSSFDSTIPPLVTNLQTICLSLKIEHVPENLGAAGSIDANLRHS